MERIKITIKNQKARVSIKRLPVPSVEGRQMHSWASMLVITMAVPPILHNKLYFRQGYANAAPLAVQARKARQIPDSHPGSPASLTPQVKHKSSVLPHRLTSGVTAFISSGMDTFIFVLFLGD